MFLQFRALDKFLREKSAPYLNGVDLTPSFHEMWERVSFISWSMLLTHLKFKEEVFLLLTNLPLQVKPTLDLISRAIKNIEIGRSTSMTLNW